METTTIPPTTPSVIAPAFRLLPFGLGSKVGDGKPVEDALVEDVYMPDAPNIAPEPYSGLSTWSVGGRQLQPDKREQKGGCLPPAVYDSLAFQLFLFWRVLL